MSFYNQRLVHFQEELTNLNRRYNLVGTFRFLTVLLAGFIIYLTQTSTEGWIWFLLIIPLGLFRYLMSLHEKLSSQMAITQRLIQINQNEIDYLTGGKLPFANGIQHQQVSHPYAFDLDLFGEKSLYQHLNRTATSIGQEALAQQLLNRLPDHKINARQRAIQELAGCGEWRQEFYALAQIGQDTSEEYRAILDWAERKSPPVKPIFRVLAFAVPALLVICLLFFVLTWDTDLLTLAGIVGVINLFLVSRNLKQIQSETVDSERIGIIIKKYSTLIQSIEKQYFKSEELQALKQIYQFQNQAASFSVRQLSSLLAAMNGINHALAAIITNGFYQSHVHTLHQLLNWKAKHAASIKDWLATLGTFETLNSFANFAYNNPDFAYPTLSQSGEVSFKSLAHPLLRREKRVANDVTFHPQFIILTGSNMSGKSTFLRTLGINLLLTNVGSCVCATAATVQPMDILVSMRLSDSLADSESYFFAEVKRLKEIITTLNEKVCFVLLDEIFRGTNSDDKRSGTIEVIKKLIEKRAIGVIATHDLEVCDITADYPEMLSNKCFEAEIINDELFFSYQLLEGICQNRSATFLMRKMGVI
ncbi:DNA mismatch repair protein [Siphonobacter sp. SORGH_AS_1065]|uniref:MutS-related protein n=1 Tax=Siphonobacter sp. SORGH_AS_1065 TaxID=3041795 RepID=UPI002788E34B|nr:DNA mismatch repair protein [Siphonobacter sp. SORGH_AS_1065]MDQ1085768.1 DNA mismatch repair ATPase MutS [Siphonobacter sp. SORGH_AS_1065]